MTTTEIFAGERAAAAALARTADGPGKAAVWAPDPPPEPDPPGSSAALARALASFEADALAQEPDSIVLADDSDAALAAALVAAKLLIRVSAADAARDPSSANGRLIAQLADAYTRPA